MKNPFEASQAKVLRKRGQKSATTFFEARPHEKSIRALLSQILKKSAQFCPSSRFEVR